MWILTESGFVSVVRHRDNPGHVLVRGRDRQSLDSFCDVAGLARDAIVGITDADYRFRVLARDDELKAFLAQSVDELDYYNFKGRVWESRGARWHDVLLEVWRTLRRLQEPTTPRSG